MRTRGVTLVEVIVVITILMTLAALLFLAIAPGAKRAAIETRIRSDLKQITSAIAIYRADYDDGFPPNLDVLPTGTPLVYPNWPVQSELCPGCQIGVASYSYWYSHRQQRLAEFYDVGVRFDETKDAIVDARFYQKETNQEYRLPQKLEGGGYRQMRVPLRLVLGARTDGSVYWKPQFELWQHKISEVGLMPLPSDRTTGE